MRSIRLILIASFLVACGDNSAPPDRLPQPPIDSGGTPGEPDGSTTTIDGAPVMIDAAGPPAPVVACGTTTCDPMTQDCCITPNPGMDPTFTCQDIGTLCAGSLVQCDGPEDCAMDEICCARTSPATFEATCGAACNGGNANVVCHIDTDCEAGEVCCPDPMGFSACVTGAMCP